MFFSDILLAVRLATQPFSNAILALAISGVSLMMATPLAEIAATFESTRLKTVSISCIMRSNTTGTSVPLGLNSANRWVSINMLLLMSSFTAKKAGLNRSTCPTWPRTWCFFASAMSSFASSTVCVMGFSRKTCFPISMAFFANLWWYRVGVTISTTSTAAIRSSSESKALKPHSAVIFTRTSGLAS